MHPDNIIYFFGTIGGLIFIYLILNQSGGKAAIGLTQAGTAGGAKIISTLQGR